MINDNKTILQYLADGINPLSGEIFEDNHICQNSKVTRALLDAIKLLEEKELKDSNKLPDKYKNIQLTNIEDLPIDKNIICEILYLNNKYTILACLNKIYRVRTTKLSPPTSCGMHTINKIHYGKEKQYSRLEYFSID